MKPLETRSFIVAALLGSVFATAAHATQQVKMSVIRAMPLSPSEASVIIDNAAMDAELKALMAAAQAGGAAEAGVAGAPQVPLGPPLSPMQLDDLRRLYNGSSNAERESLREYFNDMGIDVTKLLGAPGSESAPSAPTLAQAVRNLEFTRTPQTVLSARSQIGFGAPKKPLATDFDAMAKWLQLQVLAGEWSELGDALRQLPSSDAVAAYTQILQTINRSQRGGGDPSQKPDPGLLPEEILAIAEASPEPLGDWQVATLAQLLKEAAAKYSTAQLLERIDAGTTPFGRQDAARRERTVRFLLAADMAAESSRYFPPLDEARAKLDTIALSNYARYHQAFANSPQAGDAAESNLRTAWGLYCEVALIGSADAALRLDAMRHAIDLLPSMPPSQGSVWLKEVFANPALAPAALEILALKAIALDQGQLDEATRMQTIVTMKEAVDTLLRQTTLDADVLRVPLRMLTTAVMGEADAALGGGGDGARRRPNQGQQSAGPQQLAFLLRAMPDERWLSVLEPSLASRAYRTSIAVATGAQEVDVALDTLAAAVERFPDQGRVLADEFLRRWQSQLGRSDYFNPEDQFFIGFARNDMGSAPLTRGRQRRNLGHLARLMLVLDEIGIDPQQLPSIASAFAACHGRTEVFTREGITAIFGRIEELPADTAASLANQMRAGLGGEWRDRRAQQQAGMKRTPKEIGEMVEKGYALALELMDQAIAKRPDSWMHSVIKAGLAIDRLQYKQAEEKQDFAAYNQYRREAFEAFAQTAKRYADLVAQGDQRDDASLFLAWFSAAVGSTELNYLTRDDLLVEGSPQDDQIDLIRKSVESLGPEAAQRHVAAFARAIGDSVAAMDPEVKPRVIRHAMRIIGEHPAGAPMRRLLELHQDLMKDEVKLRLAIDGDDRVGTELLFGVTLSMRFTQEVDRETGGFSKYLMNDIWARVGNTYRPMNYRDQLKKSLESSFGDHFAVESIGFFEAYAPATPVKEAGADGWFEKPVAYIVLKAKDPSVDRLPAMSMDMHFNDMAGPVVLAVMSNSPPIDAARKADARPMRNLEVVQVLDLRELEESRKDRAVFLEVHAKAQGILPNLVDLLPGYATALAGYEVGPKGIEERPITLVETDTAPNRMYSFYQGQPQDKEYIKADDSGFYRLPSERSWVISYAPTGASVGDSFVFPTLPAGLEGSIISRQFADMDIVEVKSPTVAVRSPLMSVRNVIAAGAVAVAIAALVVVMRRRAAKLRAAAMAARPASAMPVHVTPLSVIMALRAAREKRQGSLSQGDRLRLDEEIEHLEQAFFGPKSGADQLNGAAHDGLSSALNRWRHAVEES